MKPNQSKWNYDGTVERMSHDQRQAMITALLDAMDVQTFADACRQAAPVEVIESLIVFLTD